MVLMIQVRFGTNQEVDVSYVSIARRVVNRRCKRDVAISAGD